MVTGVWHKNLDATYQQKKFSLVYAHIYTHKHTQTLIFMLLQF